MLPLYVRNITKGLVVTMQYMPEKTGFLKQKKKAIYLEPIHIPDYRIHLYDI